MPRSGAHLVAIVAFAASCGGAQVAPSSSPATSPPAPTLTATASPSATTPQPVPGSMPTTYAPDVEPADVPAEAIVPLGADPTGEWFAFTDRGVMIVVAWAEPGAGITELPRGVAVWRREASPPHWRLGWTRERGPNAGLIEIQATAADVTGDGSDDVLIFEGTSGSGGCGSWLVLDLSSMRRIYRNELCDARVEPADDRSSGLVVTESVYRPGDAHCCPSAIRRTTLVWTGSGWRVAERIESAT